MLLNPSNLKAFFDANASRYKAPAYGSGVQADGYLPSAMLDYLLCTPHGSAPNPIATAPKIPAPFTAEQILAAISTADALKVMGSPMNAKLLDSINAQDRAACASWAALCLAAGYITSAEQTAILAILNATQNDPHWSATIPAPCDLAANFTDGMGKAPARLQMALNADGTPMTTSGMAFINAALGR